MKIQIRLAESGHSHYYADVSNVQILMHQIKKDFKIQLNNQRILDKDSRILKRQTNLEQIKQQMKKTLSSYNPNPLIDNKKQSSQLQIREYPCLYVYNQKQLLKPIQNSTEKCKEYYLNTLNQKCLQMQKLRENSYEWNQFKQKIANKNMQANIQYVIKKYKIPLQNIQEKYWLFLDNVNKCKELNIQVNQLFNLCESQCKAGKTILRSIENVNIQKCKQKFQKIQKKIESLKKPLPEEQINLKENSSYFSSNKKFTIHTFSSLLSRKEECDKKYKDCVDKYKRVKKTYISHKNKFGQKKSYDISTQSSKIKALMEESSKITKSSYCQLFQELQKISKKDKKDQKQSLISINQKIMFEQQKIKSCIQKYTAFYLELSEIHNINERIQIRQAYATYITLRRCFDQLQDYLKQMERDLYRYAKELQKRQKSSQTQEFQKIEIQSTQRLESPKKDSTLTEKQKESNLPRLVSTPGKKKIAKNNIKFPGQQSDQLLRQIEEIDKRIFFKRRLKNIQRFCQNLQKDQEKRRKKYCSKINNEFLKNFSTPMLIIDYENTTDLQLESQRKVFLAGRQKSYYSEPLSWEQQIIQSISLVNLQLNVYMASTKNDKSQKQKELQKLLQLSSGLLTKLYKKKITVQRQSIKQQINTEFELQIKTLRIQNQQLSSYIISLKQSVQHSQSGMENCKNSEDQKLGYSLDRFFQIQKYAQQLSQINQQLKIQNRLLSEQAIKLKKNMITYQLQIDQISSQLSNLVQQNQQVQNLKQQIQQQKFESQQQVQRLKCQIQSQKSTYKKQIQQLKHHFNMQKQSLTSLNKQNKEQNAKIKQLKKYLQGQMATTQILEKELTDTLNAKQQIQAEFQRFKLVLADRQVYIIRLEEMQMARRQESQTINQQKTYQLNESDPSTIRKLQLQSSFYGQRKASPKKNSQSQQFSEACLQICKCSQTIYNLRNKNEQLKLQIEQLQKQIRQMLMKQTEQQETQTDLQIQSKTQNIGVGQQTIQNRRNNINEDSHSNMEVKYQSHYYLESAEKWCQKQSKNNMQQNNQHENEHQNRIQSQGSYSKMRSFANMTNKLTISKSIEQGNLHLFLPFQNDIYIGVTIKQDQNSFTNYQEYLNKQTSQNQQIFQLDLKSMSIKINQLLRQSSLVLAVRVNKKQKKSQNKQESKVLVSGKIQFAIGFQDEDMSIKNYAPFLYQ